MLFELLPKQNIAKRILFSFFLFSCILTAISIAVILYSQYTKEKAEVITGTETLINSRVGFISEVMWNMDKPLAELSIKSLAENPNITYISISDESKNVFTNVGNKVTPFSKVIKIPLLHQNRHNSKKEHLGTLKVNVTTAQAEQHLKDNFVNILLVQTLKAIITSFAFLFLIYHILIKHLNSITSSIIKNTLETNNDTELCQLKRKYRNDELQLLVDTLNTSKLARNKHLKRLSKEKEKLTHEILIRKAAENKASNSHEELLYVLNSLTTAVYLCKIDGEVMFMNHKALNLLSQRDSLLATTDKSQYLNKIIRFNKENDVNSPPLDVTKQVSINKFISKTNAYCLSNDGREALTPVGLTVIPTNPNNPLLEPSFIVVVEDKSGDEKLKEMNYIVSHDYLTKIYNRKYISEQLERVLQEEAEKYSFAIIDLDKFKAVNDTCGHRAGDELLKLVAKTIPKSLDKNDILARIGGDEFAILFNSEAEISKKKSFNIIADLEKLNFTFDGKLLPISCSIGITNLRKNDKKIESVMTRADEACYLVKSKGKGSVEVYRSKITTLHTAEACPA